MVQRFLHQAVDGGGDDAGATADGRPHCGKNLVGLPPSYVASHQPEWDDFLAVVNQMDPAHKFTNDLVRATL